MATLNSASTYAQIQAAYDDNSGYEADSSAAECQIFIQACNLLLRRNPASAAVGPFRAEFRPEVLREQLSLARRWLAYAQSGKTQYADLTTPRGA